MRSLYYLFPTLFAISISFLIVRAAAIALMLTDLDIRKAKFQALSAFSGTGFTTKESEAVVNHPMRRKIITGLIILGNVGIVTVIVTTTSSLVTSRMYELPINIAFLLSGTIGLYLIASRRGY
jgi:Trk-type K+ transport system membrane component